MSRVRACTANPASSRKFRQCKHARTNPLVYFATILVSTSSLIPILRRDVM